jgi:transcription initiation factor TFIID subunit 15
VNGHGREPYGRPPSPRRDGRGYDRGGYEPRPYW